MATKQMKVVLLDDVPSVGQRYAVTEVPAGYARNFLIPKGLAEPATEGKVAALESQRAANEEKRKQHEEELAKLIASFAGTTVELSAKANEKGHLFKGISSTEVAAKLSEISGGDIPAHAVLLDQPIKEVGETAVPVQVGENKAEITVNVVAE